MGNEDLLTVVEVAEFLRVSRDTAYRLIHEGRVPSVTLGRSVRVPRAALLTHLERLASASIVEK